MNSHLTQVLLQASAEADKGGGSLLKFITGGGVIGYIIVLLSIVAVAFVVIHFVQIRRVALLPPEKVKGVREMVERGDLEGALEYSTLPANDCYYLRVIGAGLKRFLRSPFGAFEIKNAMEEAGAEETAKLYRTMDVIATIGAVAPLLGLLGTVQGMIGAFGTSPSRSSPRSRDWSWRSRACRSTATCATASTRSRASARATPRRS